MDSIDLRPSPWRMHACVLGVLAIAYVVFALGVWPPGDSLNASLTQVVIVLYGLALSLFAAVTTALVALFRHRGAPLVKAYVATGAIVGAVILAVLGR